jgi:hypothetical protein
MSNLIKSIRNLQQQPTDELDQFILQCQVSETFENERKRNEMNNLIQHKDRELTQHRHELQRLRQTITEVIRFYSLLFKVIFFIEIFRSLMNCILMTHVN